MATDAEWLADLKSHGFSDEDDLKRLMDLAQDGIKYRSGIAQTEAIFASWGTPSAIRLAAGEMTAQEMRTARAVLDGLMRQFTKAFNIEMA